MVSVVVPAREAAGTIGRTLAALSNQTVEEPYEVIVVDDGSTDATAQLAEQAGPPVRIVRQPAQGPARARDRGAASAAGDVLAFTDADCFPVSGWLAHGLKALRTADLIQGQVLPDPSVPLGPFDRTIWALEENGLYETANLFVTREAFEAAGGFRESIEPARGKTLAEDIFFGWRVQRNGLRTAFCPEALVHHAVFRRGPWDYVAERARLVHFPEIARRVPELRERLFYRRLFLSRRTAAFDAALAGLAIALLARRAWPLAAGVPYARLSLHEARGLGGEPLATALVQGAADAVGLAALVCGSVRQRSAVL